MDKVWWILIVVVALALAVFLTVNMKSNEPREISPAQCEDEGGTVYGDIGDGSIYNARCSDRDMELLGYVVPGGIEGSVCCR